MSLSWLPPLALFAAHLLSIALFALTVVVHFPMQHRAAHMLNWPSRITIWITMAVVALSAVHAIGFATGRLPAAAAIIGGGAALLAAPLILQRLPDSLVNGRRGLIAFAGLAGGLAFVAAKWGA